MWYNVKTMYGADNSGEVDSTTVIQNAINAANSAGGGVVYFPPGTYKISAPLVVYGYSQLRGDGDANTKIVQTSANANCLTGTDVTQFKLSGIQLTGPAVTGTGKGIQFKLSSHQNTGFLHFEDVWVQGFGNDGIDIDTPIVSLFDRIVSQGNKGNGWNTHSSTSSTSCTWNSCYSNNNTLSGFAHTALCYSDMNGCAADGNGTAYTLTNCQSVTINGAGAESTAGDNFTISGGYGNVLVSPRTFQNAHYGIRITNGAKNCVVIGAVDNSPVAGAVAFIITDAGTTSTVMNVNNTSPVTYNGSTTVLNDGGGSLYAPGTLYLNSGGQIKFGAAADADMYRLGPNSIATDGLFTAFAGVDTAGLSTAIVSKNGAYTLGANDNTVLCNAAPGAFSVTLPSASGAGVTGQLYVIKKIDTSANVVTVATSSSQTIDGKPNATLTSQYAFVVMQSDGANWQVVGGIAVGATGPQGPTGAPGASTIDTGDTPSLWTYGAGSTGFISTNAQGNPGNSYYVPVGILVYRQIGPQTHYQFDCYTPPNGCVDFYFGCNASGAGYACRVDNRATYSCGVGVTSSWGNWSSSPGGGYGGPVTANAWHTATIDIGPNNLITVKVDGQQVFHNRVANPMGGYIGLASELAGVYYDNISLFGGNNKAGSTTQQFNVLDYGADPLNVADSTAAIQAAINAANATGYGGVVYLPYGYYKTSVPLTINGANFVSLQGDGRATRLCPTAAFTGAAAVLVTGGSRIAVNDMLIEFGGTWSSNPVADSIQVNHSPYFRSDNVETGGQNGYGINIITDATASSAFPMITRYHLGYGRAGLNFQGLAGTDVAMYANVSDCMFDSPLDPNTPCINIQDAQFINISNIIVNGPRGTCVSISGVSTWVFIDNAELGMYNQNTTPCLQIVLSGGNGPTDIYVTNSIIQGGNYAAYMNTGTHIFFNNCSFLAANSHGFYATGGPGQVFISNCIFNANARTAGTNYDLFWNYSGRIIVTNCMFNTAVNPGVAGYVAAASNFVGGVSIVSGCMFTGAAGTAFATYPTNAVNNNGDALSNFANIVASGTLSLTAGATIKFGAAGDADLYRLAANSIATDGLFTAYGGMVADGFTASLQYKTAAYTMTATDHTVIANANGAAFAVTLPSAAGIGGRICAVVKTDASANVVTVTAVGSQTIGNAWPSTYALTARNQFVMLQSDNVNWQIIGASAPVGTPATYYVGTGATAYTIPNDAAWHVLAGSPITFTVPAGMTGVATVTASVEAILTASNTAVNANLAMEVSIDGTVQGPQVRLTGMNSGIGQSGSLSSIWNFPGIAAGSHTLAINLYWNGTASAAVVSYGVMNASVVCT
jgi:hypothetical protein